jgi:polyisoprenoid-binding protein YceI
LVVLDATLNKAGQQPLLKAPAVGFDAVTMIKRSDFGLNAYVPLVSDDVHIHITVEAVEPKALAKEMAEFAAKAKSNGK